jgi:hypothetical protein
VIVVLFVVYPCRARPPVTLIPAALAVIISGPLIAEIMGLAGIAVPPYAGKAPGAAFIVVGLVLAVLGLLAGFVLRWR